MAGDVENVDTQLMIIANALASVGYRAMTVGRKILVQKLDQMEGDTPLIMEITGFGWPQADGTWWDSDTPPATEEPAV